MVTSSKESFRASLPKVEVLCSDKQQTTLANWSQFRECESIGSYIAMKDEVDLSFIGFESKKVFLPVYDAKSKDYYMARVTSSSDLREGKFGILEPKASCTRAQKNEIDLWFIPGRAFDKDGNRLGRGRGFYDRLLAEESGSKVGVPPDGKVFDEIPVDDWDVRMSFLFLEEEILEVLQIK
ncbi:MAG: 5-formyltetrahydrofolate cyclo-ligase [Lentisphaeraceae bacterium]|nr:5-formyltetrahydrofolate cyclo-ligase [Lentisphaeraceae bacterium]